MYSPSSPLPHRKRAFSEQFCEATDADGGILGVRAISHNSENNLTQIDKRNAFFDGSSCLDTGNLLSSVVKALETFDEEDSREGGINLFSDSQIKLDEMGSVPSLANGVETPRQFRTRASSEHSWNRSIRVGQKQMDSDLTWTANNHRIHEFMKIRAQQKHRDSINSDGRNDIDAEKGELPKEEERRPSLLQRINNLFRRRCTLPHANVFVNKAPMPEPASLKPPVSPRTSSHRSSLVLSSGRPTPLDRRKSFARNPMLTRPHLKKQSSSFSVLSSMSDHDQEMLEGTTVADLIRAIEIVRLREIGMETPSPPVKNKSRLSVPGEAPSPMLRKAAIAFAAGANRKLNLQKSSPTRVSPLPMLDKSDESSRRSSVARDRWRNLRTRSIAAARNPDSPVTPRDDAFKTISFNVPKPEAVVATATPKEKLLQNKRAQFVRKDSTYPIGSDVPVPAPLQNARRQMKRNISDMDRRFSAVQLNLARKSSALLDEYPLLSQLAMHRMRDELVPNSARRFSSASSQFIQANRSNQPTPCTMRRTSILPISPLAGIPSMSSLAAESNRMQNIDSDDSDDAKQRSRSKWRLIKKMMVNKGNDPNSNS